MMKLLVMYKLILSMSKSLLLQLNKPSQNGQIHLRISAQYLKRAASPESRIQELMVLLCRESGKTYANTIAEVREAVDFLRYYTAQVENLPANTVIQPLGTVLCISPWNFLLQFSQVSAAH